MALDIVLQPLGSFTLGNFEASESPSTATVVVLALAYLSSAPQVGLYLFMSYPPSKLRKYRQLHFRGCTIFDYFSSATQIDTCVT
jgi:hypothetical protein